VPGADVKREKQRDEKDLDLHGVECPAVTHQLGAIEGYRIQ
jgi:hypothetical protein